MAESYRLETIACLLQMDSTRVPRIEFCVQPIFPIFEYSVFEILIGMLDIVFGPARARGSQSGSRRAARRDRVRARYAESRVCRPRFLAVYFVMNAMSWAKTEARFGISMKNWPRNKLWNCRMLNLEEPRLGYAVTYSRYSRHENEVPRASSANGGHDRATRDFRKVAIGLSGASTERRARE